MLTVLYIILFSKFSYIYFVARTLEDANPYGLPLSHNVTGGEVVSRDIRMLNIREKIMAEQVKTDGLELSDSALLILGALKGGNAADVLMMLPEKDVTVILANRDRIVKQLAVSKLEEVKTNGEVNKEIAKQGMIISMYRSF